VASRSPTILNHPLKLALQGELKTPWIFRRDDAGPALTVPMLVFGLPKFVVFVKIDRFKAKLQRMAFPGHGEATREQEVEVLPPRPDDQVTAGVAYRCDCRRGRDYEPVSNQRSMVRSLSGRFGAHT